MLVEAGGVADAVAFVIGAIGSSYSKAPSAKDGSMKRVASIDQLHGAGYAAAAPLLAVPRGMARAAARAVRQNVLARANLRELYAYTDRTVRLGRKVARMTRQLGAKSMQQVSVAVAPGADAGIVFEQAACCLL